MKSDRKNRFSIETDGGYVHLFKPGGNTKTGDLDWEVFHFLKDTPPGDAIRSGMDAETVCQGCPFAAGNGCYVDRRALASMWKAWKAGKYPRVSGNFAKGQISGRKVRFGGYGNPSTMGKALRNLSQSAALALSYEHHRKGDEYSMVSVHSAAEATYWHDLGLRTYRTLAEGEAILPNEIECPHYSRGVQCADCGLCDPRKSAKSIVSPYHGISRKKAQEAGQAFQGIPVAVSH